MKPDFCMPLDAIQGNVHRLVMNRGVRLALAGTGIGVCGSFWLMPLLANQLHDIHPGDPVTLIGAGYRYAVGRSRSILHCCTAGYRGGFHVDAAL